jgi:hypothetical protein
LDAQHCGREGEEYAVEFITEQPQCLVEAFAMLLLPMAPLFSLKRLLRNEIETRAAETTARLEVPTEKSRPGIPVPGRTIATSDLFDL